MNNKNVFFGQPMVHGFAIGPALISKKSISFLGDLNITTGEVTGELSDLYGKKILLPSGIIKLLSTMLLLTTAA